MPPWFTGSFVKTVSATDQDFGSNGNISYSIWSGGLDHFTIDQRGQVTVSPGAALDVDNVRQYNILVRALSDIIASWLGLFVRENSIMGRDLCQRVQHPGKGSLSESRILVRNLCQRVQTLCQSTASWYRLSVREYRILVRAL